MSKKKDACSCSAVRVGVTRGVLGVASVAVMVVGAGFLTASARPANDVRPTRRDLWNQSSATTSSKPIKQLIQPGQSTVVAPRRKIEKVWVDAPVGGIAGGPVNDDCAAAIPIFDGATGFSTVGAVTDGPPHAGCTFFGDAQVNQDIWYDYVATQAGNLTVSLCGSGYDTKVAIYQDCPCPVDDTRLLACNDDSCGLQSQLSALVIVGQCYKIRVGGFTGSVGTGTITLSYGNVGGDPACPNPAHDCCTTGSPGCSDEVCCNVVCAADPFCCDVSWDPQCVTEATALCPGSCGTPQTNDFCQLPEEIFDGNTGFSTINATTDGNPHADCDIGFGDPQVNQDIWYVYSATATGTLQVSLCAGTSYDAKLAVYTGCVGDGTFVCPPGDAALLACDDDFCVFAGPSEVSVGVTMGNCYTVRVGGFGGATGSGIICLSYDGSCGTPPVCGPKNPQDCFVGGPNPGCNDEDCCTLVCCIDPFCCANSWDSICVDEANDFCSGSCDTTCPKGALAEEEPCGSDTNGGCNSSPPIFTEIACGDTVCGNMWAQGGTRDTDWYLFTIANDGTDVKWEVNAGFPAVAFLIAISPDCSTIEIVGTGVGTCPIIATPSCPLAAGTYVAFVAPAVFDCLPCDTGPQNDYVARLSCQPPACNTSCPPDIVPPGGDGQVNVSDLLEVIAKWGACQN